MDEITIKDTLEYLKDYISEENKSFIFATLPGIWLLAGLWFWCLRTLLITESTELIFCAALLGTIIIPFLLVWVGYKAAELRKRLDHLRGICNKILIGDIITSREAINEYHKVYAKSLWKIAEEQVENKRKR